jgi:hypothetical protein
MKVWVDHMSYSILAKIFHWGVVALFAYGIFKQVEGDVGMAKGQTK